MNVELVTCTPNALELLIYTKGTRLQGEQDVGDIIQWTENQKLEELEYMKKTIQSSFEFVNYVFRITGVSRTFTHQLVRSRHNSYAQEAMRAVDVRENGYRNPLADTVWAKGFDENVGETLDHYSLMVDSGIPRQDAREILPTGMLTSIMVSANLRSLAQMAELRLYKRAQGEYQGVFKEIKKQVMAVHPWTEDFLQVACVKTGICIFPNYEECPVQQYTVKVSDATKRIIHDQWEVTDHEANPAAKDGRTM